MRHVRTIDEEIEDLNKVTLDDVKKFHQQFYGASQGELVVVGKFDTPAVQKAAARPARLLEERKPVHAHRQQLQGGPAHQHEDRNAGQGERAVLRRPAPAHARHGSGLRRRW